MELTVFPDSLAVASAAVDRVERLLTAKPDAAIALPTGRTPLPFYEELARRLELGLDLGRVRVFNLDELVLPQDDPRTFLAYMRRHAFGPSSLDEKLADIPSGEAGDIAAECERYERAVREAALDLAVLGVGSDGHVAYNLPGATAETTHSVTLPNRIANDLEIPRAARPLRAITMGLGTIRDAHSLLMLATGAGKRAPVDALRRGSRVPGLPCTALLGHPRFELLVDQAAAGGA